MMTIRAGEIDAAITLGTVLPAIWAVRSASQRDVLPAGFITVPACRAPDARTGRHGQITVLSRPAIRTHRNQVRVTQAQSNDFA
jgi:hypothetical protein